MMRLCWLLAFLVSSSSSSSCVTRPAEGGGEGEGEDEERYAPGEFGGRCAVHSDCRPSDLCVSDRCLRLGESRCENADEQIDLRRQSLTSPATVDCGLWGAKCMPATGCVLPRGAACESWASCEATTGVQACVDDRCPTDDVDDHPAAVDATPVAVPSTTSIEVTEFDVDCLGVTLDAPAALAVTVSPANAAVQMTVLQGGRLASTVNRRFEFVAEEGTATICFSLASSSGESVTAQIALAAVALADVVGKACLDEHTLGTETCDVATRCTHRMGIAACRLPAGADCAFDGDVCAGICERDVDGTARCVDERPDAFVDGNTCREGRYYRTSSGSTGAFSITGVDVCSGDCEHGFGCEQAPGDACLPDQWCVRDGALEECVDGLCPSL